MISANEQIVQRLVDAFNRDDVDAVLDTFDAECELVEPPEMPDRPDGGYRGHPGIREWMSNLRGIGAVHFEPRSFESNGDVIVSEWAASGRGQASDAPFEWTSFVVFTLRGGKVLRAQAFLSGDEARAAAGGQP